MVEKITNNMEQSFLVGVHALAPTLAEAALQVGLGHKDGEGDDVGGKGGHPSGHTGHLGFVPANG